MLRYRIFQSVDPWSSLRTVLGKVLTPPEFQDSNQASPEIIHNGMGFGLYGSLHSPQWFDLQVHRQRVLRLSTFFNGLGIKLFDGLPAIPACCRASGNGNRE